MVGILQPSRSSSQQKLPLIRSSSLKPKYYAKVLYGDDPKKKKRILFDHVWFILKNSEKWIDTSESTKVMSGQTMKEARLPPSFRFHLRDDELVCDYLEMKIHPRGGDDVRSFTSSSNMMIDVNLNHCEPWDLPGD